MKQRKFILITFLVVLVAFMLLLKPLQNRTKKITCQHHLKCLASVIYLYQSEHPKDYPQNLWDLDNGVHRFLLTCPGTGKQGIPKSPNAVDYIYIDWSKWFRDFKDIPYDYPLIYDRRLSNHEMKGINIVFVGSPDNIIWDKNAEWLKKFSIEHSEYKIQIPE